MEQNMPSTDVSLSDIKAVIQHLSERCYQTAVSKGWYDGETERGFPEEISLFHSEISEALEEYRNGHDFGEIYYTKKDGMTRTDVKTPSRYTSKTDDSNPAAPVIVDIPNKVEGIAAELADNLIRIFDSCGKRGIPLAEALVQKMEYNETREYRHGGKLA